MGKEETKGISRRSFLSGAAATGALAAVGSLVACGSPTKKTTETAGEAAVATGYAWEVAPAAIAGSDIISTIETDILVIGAGLSGCATACAAAEKGGNVTVVEKTASYVGRGGGFGALNSRYMEACGAVVDKVNAKAHWMAQCSSRVNEDLIVKFFKHSEEASNWFLDKADAVKAFVMVGAFYSHDDVYAEQPGYHLIMGGEGMESKQFVGAELLYKDAVKAGATFVFSSPAEQLTTDESGAVTGCICKTDTGYVKYVAKNTVLCTGDIGGNREMCEAYAPVCIPYGFDRSQYMPAGVNTGDGHKMGMWAGAQLQDLPLPTMMHPQAFCWFHGPFLFVNAEGKRFMNEDTWVQGKSLAINKQTDGYAWSVFDANWPTDLLNGLPFGGGMFWDSFRAYGSDISEAPKYFETQIPTYIESGIAFSADTLEELATKIGADPATFKTTIEHYNEVCVAGEDTDYYKKPVFLTPVKQGPFYALKVGPALLTVTGGLNIDNDFNCKNAEGSKIQGLYALGNCMGDITAVDYPINVPGNSHGRCITYGYLLGNELASA